MRCCEKDLELAIRIQAPCFEGGERVRTCFVTSKGPNFIDMPSVFVDIVMMFALRVDEEKERVARNEDRNIV